MSLLRPSMAMTALPFPPDTAFCQKQCLPQSAPVKRRKTGHTPPRTIPRKRPIAHTSPQKPCKAFLCVRGVFYLFARTQASMSLLRPSMAICYIMPQTAFPPVPLRTRPEGLFLVPDFTRKKLNRRSRRIFKGRPMSELFRRSASPGNCLPAKAKNAVGAGFHKK